MSASALNADLRDRPAAEKPAQPQPPEQNTVRSNDGTAIAFDRIGAGPPVIYVPPAFSHRSFDPAMARVAGLLASQFTVFTYDRRGRGDSGDTAPYAVDREIEDVAALVAEAGGSAYVYGMSSGAVLALEAAASGLNIAKLALFEAPFVVDDTRAPARDDLSTRLAGLVSAGQRSDAVELFLTEAVGVPAPFVTHMRQDAIWGAFEQVAHTLSYDAAIMRGTLTGGPLPDDRVERWSTIVAPAVVIDGGASPQNLHNASDALAQVLTNAARRTLPDQTHDVDPDVIAPVLAEFFS